MDLLETHTKDVLVNTDVQYICWNNPTYLTFQSAKPRTIVPSSDITFFQMENVVFKIKVFFILIFKILDFVIQNERKKTWM